MPGWDITASVPKGVTEAIEGGDERVRAALWEAVREAAADVEGLVTTRVRKGGRMEDRVTGNMIWHAFEHPETRPTDEDGMPRPDRHVHVVIPSLTLDPVEGQWKAIKWRPVVELRKYFSHRFDLRLSTRLVELGYRIETSYKPDEKGGRKYHSWDIAGMPASMLAKDSARHREIEARAERLGKTSPLEKAKLGATSRRAKRKDLTLADCREFWNTSLWAPEEVQARDECIRQAMSGGSPPPPPATVEAVRFAIAHEFYRRPVVDYTALEITAMPGCVARFRKSSTACPLGVGLPPRPWHSLHRGGAADTAPPRTLPGSCLPDPSQALQVSHKSSRLKDMGRASAGELVCNNPPPSRAREGPAWAVFGPSATQGGGEGCVEGARRVAAGSARRRRGRPVASWRRPLGWGGPLGRPLAPPVTRAVQVPIPERPGGLREAPAEQRVEA